MIDSHAHLDMEPFDPDRAEALARAREAGLRAIVNIALGPDRERLERGWLVAQGEPDVACAVGVHPHDAEKVTPDTVNLLREMAKRPKVVAIGEIGLDYYYENSPRDRQCEAFGQFLDLALELKRPVSIHSRDAFDDTVRLTSDRDIFQRVGGVLHCFTGTKDQARTFLNAGAYISFSGIVTFKKARELHETAKYVPLDRMLIETDAPYLAPEPNRGKRNEPAFVTRVAEVLAELKGISAGAIKEQTSRSAEELFRLREVLPQLR